MDRPQGLAPIVGPLARTSDPATSKIAGAQMASDEIALRGLHGKLLALVAQNPGWTARELAVLSGERDLRTLGRRVVELVRGGLLHYGPARRDTATKRMAHTIYLGTRNEGDGVRKVGAR